MPDDVTIGPDLSDSGVSRRGFLKGALGFSVAAGLAGTTDSWLDGARAVAAEPGALPTTGTSPEQVHLTFGRDPSRDMTVSWASPGTAADRHPHLHYGTVPPRGSAPGTQVEVESVSFTDGLNLETVHWYHAEITGLRPGQTYYYALGDGASPDDVVQGRFTMAPPHGRASYRFTSYGDLATPTAAHNVSGETWTESSDNSLYAVAAVEAAEPLFHLLNGDLCYANLNPSTQPEVWRDFGRNISTSAANRPWMPTLGNHEIEFGDNGPDGSGTGIFNGPHGYGSYQTRFRLPSNGVAGFDGNFYSFQVGTVLFVALDADDVIYQDGGSYYAPATTTTTPLPVPNPAVTIPPGASTYNHGYTGDLAVGPADSLVPDRASPTPNQQTLWLERTLRSGRQDPSVDMIVVFMHQCALSSSAVGNGSDLGIRQAWLPLFDAYGVDLVLSGHEHDYERSHAVRGYDPGATGTVVSPNPGQLAGAPVATRRPAVVPAETTVAGLPAVDTARGTVFLVLGGGGTDGPTNVYGTDTADGLPQAKVITTRNLITHNATGGFTKNGADSVEDAPWSAMTDPADSYGVAVFDVDPGSGPGHTTLTMSYYHASAASAPGAPPFNGTTSYSLFEQVVFGRKLTAS